MCLVFYITSWQLGPSHELTSLQISKFNSVSCSWVGARSEVPDSQGRRTDRHTFTVSWGSRVGGVSRVGTAAAQVPCWPVWLIVLMGGTVVRWWVRFVMILQNFLSLYKAHLVVKSTLLRWVVSHFSRLRKISITALSIIFHNLNRTVALTLGHLQAPIPVGTKLRFGICRRHARTIVPHWIENTY